MEEVNVNQVEMFLSKLEERATDLVELAEKVKAESSTQDITAYRPFRDRVDDFKALSILIEDRLGRMTSTRRDELAEQFHKLQVLMLKVLIKASLSFFYTMSAKSVLPLGSREVFEIELKTLYDAEAMLSDPRYEGELDDEAKEDLDLAKDLLGEILAHAPSLLDFSGHKSINP